MAKETMTEMLKQKKVPQRGLGVAQLERIRLEEQHIKAETFHVAASVLSPNSNVSAHEDPTFRPTVSLKNSDLTPIPSTPFLDILCPKASQSRKQLKVDGGERNWLASLVPGYNDCSKWRSSEYSLEEKNQKLYHHGVVIQPNINLSQEPQIPIFSLSTVLHGSQQYQQSSCSSSMVNFSSGISSASIQKVQMELPSNQSYYGCDYLPLWPEEVKMVGMKRPYPFTPDYPPVPAFRCKFPRCYDASVSKSHESTSNSDECTTNSISSTLLKRVVPLKSRTLSEAKPRNFVRENRVLNGDFLTLAPPTTVGAGNQQALSNSALQNAELFKFESATFREITEEPSTRSVLDRSVHQPVFRFFPSTNMQNAKAGTNKSNCYSEVGGKVDLNLKL